MVKMMNINYDENTSALFNQAKETRLKMQSECFAAALPKLGKETVKALKEFYSLFDENLYIWYAGLWQPEIGGFYYSNSARDTEGFLPDLESTVQALRFAQNSGLFSAYENDITKALSQKTKDALVSFAKGMQDPDDGYFYHPQWGKDITLSRRGRDLGWANAILNFFDAKPDFPTAIERITKHNSENKEKNAVVPEHFKSTEAFKEYLNTMDFEKKSYYYGNLLAAQHSQIKAAGKEYVDTVIDHLSKLQREDNGLWQEKINYDSVNGLFKISSLYDRFEKPLPNAVRAFESAIYAVLSDERVSFVCEFYNPWSVINFILSNIDKFGDKQISDNMRKILLEKAPELIRVTMRKVSAHKKADGSFSYFPNRSASKSQGAPVAVYGSNEGDINATGISSTGTLVNNICAAVGLKPIPLFCEEDSKLFVSLLESAAVTPKRPAET